MEILNNALFIETCLNLIMSWTYERIGIHENAFPPWYQLPTKNFCQGSIQRLQTQVSWRQTHHKIKFFFQNEPFFFKIDKFHFRVQVVNYETKEFASFLTWVLEKLRHRPKQLTSGWRKFAWWNGPKRGRPIPCSHQSQMSPKTRHLLQTFPKENHQLRVRGQLTKIPLEILTHDYQTKLIFFARNKKTETLSPIVTERNTVTDC